VRLLQNFFPGATAVRIEGVGSLAHAQPHRDALRGARATFVRARSGVPIGDIFERLAAPKSSDALRGPPSCSEASLSSAALACARRAELHRQKSP
jgi:hypothetical protein